MGWRLGFYVLNIFLFFIFVFPFIILKLIYIVHKKNITIFIDYFIKKLLLLL